MPADGSLANAEASPSPFAGADLTANADISRVVWDDPQSGHGTAGEEPLTFTSSSKRWSQLLHANS